MVEKYFRSLEASKLKSQQEDKEALLQGITKENVYLVESLEYTYFSLGIISYCYHGNVELSKKYFYQATLCTEWNMEHYDEYKEKLYPELVTTYSYPSLYYAILSCNKEHRKKRAELFGKYAELEKNDYFSNILLGYSLKYVILNDKQMANQWLDELEKAKGKRGMKQFVEGHGNAMRGIINEDAELFQLGLKKMLSTYVARMKREGNELHQYFAYEAIALALLAKERNISIDIEHNLLPKEYLEETEIDYSKITMYEQLE